METPRATHAEAVYLARALNLNIETVWDIIQDLPYSPYPDLELAVHSHIARIQSRHRITTADFFPPDQSSLPPPGKC